MLKLVPQIKYAHSKLRYEIEIPNDLVKGDKKPEDLVLTSHRVGFQRFHTEELRSLYERYLFKCSIMKEALTPFVCALF